MHMETYWRRVRYNGDVPWELKAIPGKGVAAFALRDFEAGEWICTEFPVTWIEGHHPFSDVQLRIIEEKVNGLSKEDFDAFYAMANVFDTESDTVSAAGGIFMTNCFDMTDSIYGTSCAMYLALARLNHSCTPNVQQSHVPETTEEVLYASRAIKRGEELNDSYIDLNLPRDRRRQDLSEYYRFHCECAGCTGIARNTESESSSGGSNGTVFTNTNENSSNGDGSSGQLVAATEDVSSGDVEKWLSEDDRVRIRTAKHGDSLIDLVEAEQYHTALDIAVQMVTLLEQPRYLNWSARYMSETCVSVYQIATAMDKRKMAGEYLQRAHRWNVLLTGPKSEETKGTAEMIAKNRG